MTSPRRRALVAVGVVAALAGCSLFGPGGDDPVDATPVPSPSMAVGEGGEQASDPAFAAFYGQDPGWSPCDGETESECGSVRVPVDWDAPDGSTIELSLARYSATGEREGALLLNFGGPGVAGADFVMKYGEFLTTADVRDAYDLIGFDPRGVGESSGVDCLTDRELDQHRAFDPQADLDTDLSDAIAEIRTEAKGFAQACQRRTGPLLAHVGTISAARDMDVIRDALGQERLDYLGFSYGTLLGATFADLFPQRVDRFVLDGAVDPANGDTALTAGQAAGIERALRSYIAACLDGSVGRCPLKGSVDDGMKQVADLIALADDDPLPTEQGRSLTVGLAFTGVIAPLYDDGRWDTLTEALSTGLDGDGTQLLALSDEYSSREPDGTYSSNLQEAFPAVNCLDYPVDDSPEAMEAAAAAIQDAAPFLGEFMSYGETSCGEWPFPATRTPGPLDAAGAPPILVIGTTNDPATPYGWARSLAHQLDSGVLLTYEGDGHTAFGRGSRCIDRAVEAFLIRGRIVPNGTRCS